VAGLEAERVRIMGGTYHPPVAPPITSWIIEGRSVRCDLQGVRNT
jgi:hypothetical protein